MFRVRRFTGFHRYHFAVPRRLGRTPGEHTECGEQNS
jgi:hypothetical protein